MYNSRTAYNLICKVFVALALSSCASIHGAIVFDRGTLITELAYTSEYTNNARNSASGQEDWINTLTPTLKYSSYGTEWQSSAAFGVSFVNYSKTDQDNENINFSASASHPRGISFSGSVREDTGGDSEFGQIVRTRNYSFSATVSYSLTPLIPVSTGISYSKAQPLDESNGLQRSPTESLSIPFDIAIPIHDKIRVGYAFGMQQTSGNQNISDSTTHSVFANVTDDIFPRVTGNLSVGGQMRQSSDVDSQFSPFASGGLNWQFASRTSARLNLSAGFQNTTGNRISREMSVSVGLSHQFPRNVSGTLSTGFSSNEFSDVGQAGDFTRSDSSWNLGASLSTKIYEHTNLGLSVDYRSNSSNQSTSEFDSYSISFTASRPF